MGKVQVNRVPCGVLLASALVRNGSPGKSSKQHFWFARRHRLKVLPSDRFVKGAVQELMKENVSLEAGVAAFQTEFLSFVQQKCKLLLYSRIFQESTL